MSGQQHKQVISIKLELGHTANIRDEVTPDGFTHDWTLFVRGVNGSKIEYFVEKVVFYLHESFKQPKRTIKQPPYQVSESGYACFTVRIELFFQNKGGSSGRKMTLDYDLTLRQDESFTSMRMENLTFLNPAEEFREKLLLAGGVVINHPALEAAGAADTIKKPKPHVASKEHPKPKPNAGGMTPTVRQPTTPQSSLGWMDSNSQPATPSSTQSGGSGRDHHSSRSHVTGGKRPSTSAPEPSPSKHHKKSHGGSSDKKEKTSSSSRNKEEQTLSSKSSHKAPASSSKETPKSSQPSKKSSKTPELAKELLKVSESSKLSENKSSSQPKHHHHSHKKSSKSVKSERKEKKEKEKSEEKLQKTLEAMSPEFTKNPAPLSPLPSSPALSHSGEVEEKVDHPLKHLYSSDDSVDSELSDLQPVVPPGPLSSISSLSSLSSSEDSKPAKSPEPVIKKEKSSHSYSSPKTSKAVTSSNQESKSSSSKSNSSSHKKSSPKSSRSAHSLSSSKEKHKISKDSKAVSSSSSKSRSSSSRASMEERHRKSRSEKLKVKVEPAATSERNGDLEDEEKSEIKTKVEAEGDCVCFCSAKPAPNGIDYKQLARLQCQVNSVSDPEIYSQLCTIVWNSKEFSLEGEAEEFMDFSLSRVTADLVRQLQACVANQPITHAPPVCPVHGDPMEYED